MKEPTLLVTPRRSALLAGHDNTLDVLVRVQAPDAPPDLPPRNPLNLAVVIDRSGSMSGQPLLEAKRCAEFVLDGLQPADRLALVVYDDGVDTLVPALPVADAREVLRRAIRQIDSGGSTNLHGGWHQGVQTLLPHASRGTVSRVILLSDGCANSGLVEPHGDLGPVPGICRRGCRHLDLWPRRGLQRRPDDRHGAERRRFVVLRRVRRRPDGPVPRGIRPAECAVRAPPAARSSSRRRACSSSC